MQYRPTTAGGSAVQAAEAARMGSAVRSSLQQAARPGAPGPNLQAMAASVAAQQGTGAVQQAAQGVQSAQQQAAVRMQGVQQGAEKSIADRRFRLKELQMESDRDLADLGLQLGRESFDNKLAFQRDEMGRLAMNNIQLGDWAVMSAKNKEDFMNKAQTMELAHSRNMELLSTAHAKVVQALELESKGKQIQLSQEAKERLVRAEVELKRQMAEAEAKARNEMMLIQGVFTIAGAGIGAFTPVGPIAGAALGQGAGAMAAGAYSANK